MKLHCGLPHLKIQIITNHSAIQENKPLQETTNVSGLSWAEWFLQVNNSEAIQSSPLGWATFFEEWRDVVGDIKLNSQRSHCVNSSIAVHVNRAKSSLHNHNHLRVWQPLKTISPRHWGKNIARQGWIVPIRWTTRDDICTISTKDQIKVKNWNFVCSTQKERPICVHDAMWKLQAQRFVILS